jgi:hypothetical protein
MPRIDRKVKRNIARSLKARSLREKRLEAYNFERGMHAGMFIQKAKVNNATLGMGYLYEYSVGCLEEPQTVVDNPAGDGIGSVTVPCYLDKYDYPDADAIPA